MDADLTGLQTALRMAQARYGTCIAVTGTATFKAHIAQAAAAANLPITFDDPALEQRRQVLQQSMTPRGKHQAHQTHQTHQTPESGINAGANPVSLAAAEKYIAKREAKRQTVSDIPVHRGVGALRPRETVDDTMLVDFF